MTDDTALRDAGRALVERQIREMSNELAELRAHRDRLQAELATEVSKAKLGLASTRELLEEMGARGRSGKRNPLSGRAFTSNATLDRNAWSMLTSLDPETLDYRTVS